MKKILFLLFLLFSTASAQDTCIVYGVKNAAGKIAKIIPGINKDSVSGGGGAFTWIDTTNDNWIAPPNINGVPSGGANTVAGDSAGKYLTSGHDNTLLGHAAGLGTTSGSDNTLIGSSCGDILVNGNRNAALGKVALSNIISGSDNVAVGFNSLANLSNQTENTSIGSNSSSNLSSSNSRYNVAAGSKSLFNATDEGNSTSIGAYSLYSQDSGNYNAALGYKAGTISGLAYTAFARANFIGGESGDNAPFDFSNGTIIGSISAPSRDLYLNGFRANDGNVGDDAAIHGQAGTGTNQAGGNLTLNAGGSSGNANGGDIIFKSSTAGSTGTSDNALVELFRFTSLGEFKIAGGAGTSGQVLTSGGAGAAPSWGNISSKSAIFGNIPANPTGTWYEALGNWGTATILSSTDPSDSSGGNWSSSVSSMPWIAPANGTLSKFKIARFAAEGAGDTVVVTIMKNGVAESNLSITFVDGDRVKINSSETITVTAGDFFSIRTVSIGDGDFDCVYSLVYTITE